MEIKAPNFARPVYPQFVTSERPDMARWSSIDHMKPKSGA